MPRTHKPRTRRPHGKPEPIAKLDGDEGARKLLKGAAAGQVIEVEVSGMAAMLDVDTPQGLAEARRALEK